MNSRQIESWALRVIDCVKSGQPNEDFLVELKREWIQEYKAARRIAGHANAARGENILWLIGVDEEKGVDCVIGANAADIASWYPTVESFFNELAPRMIPLNIPVDNKTVVALLFETDRAPFVVKNQAYGSPGGGSVELEVPWRENTSIRSARRSDLIRLLAPLELLPEIEILGHIELTATIAGKDVLGNPYPDELRLNSELYIVPKSRERVIIPFHLCRVEFEISGIPTFESNWISLNPAGGISIGRMTKPGSLTIESTAHEIIIDGSGKISLQATAQRPSLPEDAKNCDIRISIYLLPTGANRPVVLTKTLPYPIEKLPS
ncbi:hypothetical protein [Anabaena lutea]|uniref:Schlafen AlbA-2 domain-containing protein n=1 Tax=Anabaena lutea FACHB-196 TaxID=2692881 RepID=A0ABR8FH71_9NOST|nr:hypothetical protein [Anabaena lutea]MBD2569358.1 hypothetical protein [Anabaena lutea FACHB-196]